MSLRVIAGTARGMKLKPVPGCSTRPIMDRVKEALFNIIGSDIRDANILDLFAGTGSVGIEALSRGAARAHFNERDRAAIKTIYHNLDHTGLKSKARVTRRDAFDLISRSPERNYRFIYVAPPQYKGIWLKTLAAFDANRQWHNPDRQIIVQIDPSEYDTNPPFERLLESDQRKYGRTMLLFYRFALHSDAR
ncbi:MAG: 16S rRNA (guanine(966)-N(2))-methyltransferase RsmD [Chloroflexi bacterium]|nr:16S rRNA (guanine(966)-N(2))-methyltransferase RsmD [Chloroflexota bacterium]